MLRKRGDVKTAPIRRQRERKDNVEKHRTGQTVVCRGSSSENDENRNRAKHPLIDQNGMVRTLGEALAQYPSSFTADRISIVGKGISVIDRLPPTHIRTKTIYLSRNRIRTLEGISQFRSLRTLSVSDNFIFDYEAIAPLSAIRTIRTLNLEGNPINRRPHYRHHVIHHVPQLEQLDKRAVGDFERAESESIVASEQSRLRECVRRDCELVKLKTCGRLLRVHSELRQLTYGRPGALSRHRNPPNPCFRLSLFMRLCTYERCCSEGERRRVCRVMENDVVRVWTVMCLERVRDRSRAKVQLHRSELWNSAYATVASLQQDAYVKMSAQVESLAERALREHVALVRKRRSGGEIDETRIVPYSNPCHAVVASHRGRPASWSGVRYCVSDIDGPNRPSKRGALQVENVAKRRIKDIDDRVEESRENETVVVASRDSDALVKAKRDLAMAKEVLRVRVQVERKLRRANEALAARLKRERRNTALVESQTASKIENLKAQVKYWRGQATAATTNLQESSLRTKRASLLSLALVSNRRHRAACRDQMRRAWNRLRVAPNLAGVFERASARSNRRALRVAFNIWARLKESATSARGERRGNASLSSSSSRGGYLRWRDVVFSRQAVVARYVAKRRIRKIGHIFRAWISLLRSRSDLSRKIERAKEWLRRRRLRRAISHLRSNASRSFREMQTLKDAQWKRRVGNSSARLLKRVACKNIHLLRRLCFASWKVFALRARAARMTETRRRVEAGAFRKSVEQRAQDELSTRYWKESVEATCEARLESERQRAKEQLRLEIQTFEGTLSTVQGRSSETLKMERKEALEALEAAKREILHNQENNFVLEAAMARRDVMHQRKVVGMDAAMRREQMVLEKNASEMKETMDSMTELLEKQQGRMHRMEEALEYEARVVQNLRDEDVAARENLDARSRHSNGDEDRLEAIVEPHMSHISEMAHVAASQIANAIESSSSATENEDGRVEEILADEISSLEKALLSRLGPALLSFPIGEGNGVGMYSEGGE
eukprot:g2775.t1